MLKVLYKKWEKNREALKTAISRIPNVSQLEYEDLVKLTFSTIYNDGDDTDIPYGLQRLDCEQITRIDNGDYQGTLLFLIPFDTYQPSESEYLMTYVGYGSCSGCDTLLSIIDWGDKSPNESQVSDLLALCKDIVTNTIKPYNVGWRNETIFEPIKF
jgi:hypothetical protein